MDLPHQELTRKVIAAAIAVHRKLRPGLDEKLYERALCIELALHGIGFTQQPRYPAHYKGHLIGNLVPDLVIEETLIVDTKCVDAFHPAHEAQMIWILHPHRPRHRSASQFQNLAPRQTPPHPPQLSPFNSPSLTQSQEFSSPPLRFLLHNSSLRVIIRP